MAVMVGETITLEKIRRLPSRTGRELQVYEHGRRQVVGCIPYQIVQSGRNFPELQVLMVSSQKGTAMMFPKGGWESDESIEQAAIRESLEEAGVVGTLQSKLGQWRFKSKSQDKFHDGHIFPMHVSEMYDHWPEKSFRQRKWVKAEEAMKICPYSWMKEALDTLINRLSQFLDQPAESGGYEYEYDGGKSGLFSDGAASWRKNIQVASGVVGILQSKLGQWRFKSKSQDKFHDGHIFPMHVSEMYDHWPEKSFRQRLWVKADEAMEICPYSWMREALDTLINRLSQFLDQPDESGGYEYEYDGGKSGRFSDGAASWRKNIQVAQRLVMEVV